MTAYYNENDDKAVIWLRNNMEAGLIAPGVIDNRSIKDVQPSDLEPFTQVHFFAGIGVWSHAARSSGWSDDRPLWTASCPCQPFSAAGKGGGEDDPRHLWPDVRRLASARRPSLLVGEQVSGKAGERWFDGVRADLAAAHYTSRAVDVPACAVDAPHQRNRLFWLAVSIAECGGWDGGDLRYHEPDPAYSPDGGHRALVDGRDAGSQGIADAGRVDGHQGRWSDAERADGRDSGSGEVDSAEGQRPPWSNADQSRDNRQGQPQRPDGGVSDGGLADRHGAWELQREGRGEGVQPFGGGRHLHGDGEGPRRNGSWWVGADWINCHDDKARRVADARAPLLVNGVAGGIPVHRPSGFAPHFAEGEDVRIISRVAAWKGFGNAIVEPLAAEFMASIRESIDLGEIVLCR